MRRQTLTLRISELSRIAAILITLFLFAGKTAAGQQISDLGDSPAGLLDGSRGKVLVLLFVRTDCPISNRYAPLIQQFSRKYGHAASFRLVFPDRNESADKIKRFLSEYHYQLPAIRDVNQVLVKKTGAKVTPEAAVFDAQGVMVYHGRIDNLYEHIGQARRAATTHELADAIDAAIKGVKNQNSAVDAVGCFISDLE